MIMMEVHSKKSLALYWPLTFQFRTENGQSALDGLPERIPDMQQRVNFCEKNAIKTL
jgi:hypothetical protein